MREMSEVQRAAAITFLEHVAGRWAQGDYDDAEHLCRILWERAEKLAFVDTDEIDR